ncbi:hypothetical protein KDE12_01095 [Campylobacter sp. faydin G-105]|uniref:hypothetical protein n=1 Tax=Campylobacter anatolicus TaxID=2829105 RepID=UPI001B8EBB42|nr:hypothetical protein [Campylobacter anatolicus]MBR8461447.1 hypothetical protein [Campylobacter anatolicus]
MWNNIIDKKDMHKKAWDKATLTKLNVFEALLFEWLNIALEATKKFNKNKEIAIYDLCCGTGHDADGKDGSPLRIINVLTKMTNYETHKVVAGYFKKMYPKYHIGQFSLVKDNKNTNGLIFFSEHRKGQEKFLEAAWEVDPANGEGNKNLNNDFYKQEGSLFFDENSPTSKMENYKQDLMEFLKEYRNNIEIKYFSLDMGFLTKHTNAILKKLETNNKIDRIGGKEKAFYLSEENEKMKIRLRYETD